MFYTSKVFKGSFNRYYLLPGSGISSSLIWLAQAEDLFSGADSFVRGLNASDSDWRDLLWSFSDIDLRHTQKSHIDLVADLVKWGRIRAYEVPGPDELHTLAGCTQTDKKTGQRANHPPEFSLHRRAD